VPTFPAQRSFAYGEVAPAYYAGADRALYRQALRALRNGVVSKTGGIRARPGTVYKGTTKSSAWARLIPVVFDDDQNYVIELGNATARFWRDGSLVTATVLGAWADATAYLVGQVVSYSGTNYVALQSHTSVLANDRPSTGSSWQSYWYALSGTTYELPTPWTTQAIVRALQFQVDTGGVVRFAHASTSRRTLTRYADNRWGFAVVTSGVVSLDFPTNLTTDAPTPGTVASWVVTAYDAVNGVESLASAPVSSDTAPNSPTDVFTQSWDAVTGATKYRVYRSDNESVYGFLRETSGTSLIDTGITPDFTTNPPEAAADFSVSGDYPGVIGAYQQRVIVSGSTNAPATVLASRVGSPDDFTISSPLVDSDAVSWTMVGPRVVRPRHFVEVARRLIQFASTGEYVIEGDDTGILSPGAVNPRELSANGAAAYPAPLKVHQSALYVQAKGGIVRDVVGDAGDDLTLMSSHLVDGYTIVEWAFQPTPTPIVWCVRSDGALLSLTYERTAGIFAWARHDTDGTFESVCCVEEGNEDAVYVVVNRTINSSTVRYVERFANQTDALASRVIADAAVVASLAHPHSTLTVATGSGVYAGGWLYSDVAATGSGGSGSFVAADVGRTFAGTYGGHRVYGWVRSYTSATVVRVDLWTTDDELPVSTVFTTGDWWWTSARGLDHLEGEAVSITLDGAVLASPYNTAVTVERTVEDGIVSFAQDQIAAIDSALGTEGAPAGDTDTHTTAVIGLPFTTDIETLDIDVATVTRKPSGVLVTNVGLWLNASRTPFVGTEFPDATTGLTYMQQMPALDDDENTTTGLITGHRLVNIDGAWTEHGRIAIRHVDPSPLEILSITPYGDFGR